MNCDSPTLCLEHVFQLLDLCMNGHDCHNERALIEAVVSVSSGWLLKRKNSLTSADRKKISDKINAVKLKLKSYNCMGSNLLKATHKKRKNSLRSNIAFLKKVLRYIGWKYSIEKLRHLFDIWNQFDYIRCDDFEQFKAHFFGTASEIESLTWYGSSIDLSIWFCRLMNIGAINKNKYLKVMCSHFVLPGNIPVNYDSAVTNANKTLTSEIEEDRIDKIMMYIME